MNDGFGSNCDLRHRLVSRLECDDEPTFGPEHRLFVIGNAGYGGAASYESRVVVLNLEPRYSTSRPNVIIHIDHLGGIQASQRHLNPITQNFFMH